MILESLKKTEIFASQLAKQELAGLSVGLIGELGAGKTTLVKALVAALGSKEDVSSPSYVLQHEYEVSNQLVIEHWDIYRLQGQSEGCSQGLPEELLEPQSKRSLRLIEWIDIDTDLLKGSDFIIHLGFIDENKRSVRLEGISQAGSDIVSKVQKCLSL